MTENKKISALVINLKQSTKRLEFQKKQLEYLKILWEPLLATSVSDIDKDMYERLANSWERKMRPTEVACFLSHKKAWEYVVSANHPVLILEDDAILSIHTKKLIENIINQHNANDFDHISLETRNRKKLLSKEEIVINECFSVSRMFQDRTGAAAYILSPEGAKKLLRKAKKTGPALADAFLCREYSLISYQVVPAAAIQSDQCQYYAINIEDIFPSTIALTSTDKPKATKSNEQLIFKYRRIISQIRMGIRHLSVFTKSKRIHVFPRKKDFLLDDR